MSAKDSKSSENGWDDFERLFRISNDLLSVSDAQGNLLRVNAQWTHLLGYSEQELLEQPLKDRLHPDDLEKTQNEIQSLFSGKKETSMFENRCRKKSGEYVWLEWNAVVSSENNKAYAIARDIDWFKEKDTFKRNAQEAIIRLSELSSLEDITLETFTDKLIREVRQLFEVDSASFWSFGSDDMAIKCISSAQENEKDDSRTGLTLTQNDAPTYFNTILNEKLVVATDTYKSPYTQEFKDGYLPTYNIKSLMDAQVMGKAGLKGIICLETSKTREWTIDEQNRIISFASILSVACLNHERLKEQLELEKLSLVAKNVQNSVIITDASGKIIWVNDAFKSLSGYELNEVLGKKPGHFLQGKATSKRQISSIRKGLKSKKPFREEILNYTKTGKPYWIGLYITPIFDEEGKLLRFIGIQNDITDKVMARKELEEKSHALEEYSQHLKALHELSLSDTSNLKTLLNNYVLIGRQLFGLDVGIISQIIDKKYILISVQSGDMPLTEGQKFDVDDTYCREVIRKKRTFAHHHFGADKKLCNHPVYQTQQIESYIGTPIWVDDEIYGTLNFSSPGIRKSAFRNHEVELIELMADDLGKVISTHQAKARQWKAEEHLKFQVGLQKIILDLSSRFINLPLEDIDEEIDQALAQIGQFVNADRSYVFEYNFDAQTTSNTNEWCQAGITPQLKNLQNVPLDITPEWVEKHKKGEMVYIPDTSVLKNNRLKDLMQEQQIKSVMTLPLYADKCVGFVGFDWIQKHHRYDENEQSLLQVFAEMLVNIHLRKASEKKLKESEEKYRSVVNALSEGIVIQDMNDVVTGSNQSACEILGLTQNQLKGKDSYDPQWQATKTDGTPLDPEEHPSVITQKTGRPVHNFRMNISTGADKRRTISVNSEPITNDSGNVYGTVTSFLDVTEQEETLRALKASESRYKKLTEAAPVGIVVHARGKLKFVNHYGTHIMEAESSESLIGEEVLSMLKHDPEMLKKARERIRKLYSGEMNYAEPLEEILVTQTGKEITVLISGLAIEYEGEPAILNVFTDITPLKETEQALKESESRIRDITNSVPGIVQSLIISPDNEVSVDFINDEIESITGYKKEDFIQNPALFWQIVHEGDLPRLQEIRQNTPLGSLFDHTWRIWHKDGYLKWLRGRGVGSLLPGGFVQRNAIILDVTQQKEIENTLFKREEQYRLLAVNSYDTVISYNNEQILTYVSPAIKRLTGIEDSYFQSRNIWDLLEEFVHEEDKKDTGLALSEAETQKKPLFSVECRVWSKEIQDYLWIQYKENRLYDKYNNHVSSVANIVDITERKKAEIQLKQSERRLRNISNSVPGVLLQYRLRPDGQDELLYISDQVKELWEVSRQEALEDINKLWATFLPEDIPGMRASIEKSAKELSFWDHTARIRTKSGKLKWINGRGSPKQQEDGSVIWDTMIQDISTLKFTEHALIKSHERFSDLVNTINGVVWEADPQTLEFHFISNQAEELFGYPSGDWLDNPTFWKDHIHPDDRDEVISYCQVQTDAGKDHDFNYRFRKADGSYIWIKDLVHVQIENGQPVNLLGLLVDISGMKEKESELSKALDDKNTLFRELHHRIKNNLQLVSSILYLKGRKMNDETSRELIKDINGRILAIARTHEELLRLEEVDELYIRPYLVNLVRKVASSYAADPEDFPLKYYIQNYKLKADQVVVMGLIVHECVVNIIKYAYPADEGGPIYLGFNKSKGKMYLEICDDGKGFDLTKEGKSKAGKSIGVLLLEALADQLGGNVSISVDNGSMFRFTFEEVAGG